MPPLAGFAGKLYLFGAAVSAQLTWLALFALVMSVVSAGFYFRIVRAMFFAEPAEGVAEKPGSPRRGVRARSCARSRWWRSASRRRRCSRRSGSRSASGSPSRTDPLHGVTLETILRKLVNKYGWDGLAKRIDINCFKSDPSINSSLKFLRKTPWARKEVEDLYVNSKFWTRD